MSSVLRRNLHLCITGIGNKEPYYKQTRHNAGLMLLDLIKKQYILETPWKPFTQFNVRAHYCYSLERDMLFLRSDGEYMNLSGNNVVPIWKQLLPIDISVVVYDDLSLPLGKVQLRKPGTSLRGHNGLKSIMSVAAANNVSPSFYRLAIGIGRPISRNPQQVTNYVLQKFSSDDLPILEAQALPSALQKLTQMILEYSK